MYGIGDTVWPGLGKLMEEMGELQQALAKLISTKGRIDYWDGTNLVQTIMEELADVQAAHWFFMVMNRDIMAHALANEFDKPYALRVRQKQDQFFEWHARQVHVRTPVETVAPTYGVEPMDEPQG